MSVVSYEFTCCGECWMIVFVVSSCDFRGRSVFRVGVVGFGV